MPRPPFLRLVVTVAATVLMARPAAAQECALDYQRADNMWAGYGVATSQPGLEQLDLRVGEMRTFKTEWAFEKRRNDGTTYYGSHLRVATNHGTSPVRLRLRANPTDLATLLTVLFRSTNEGYYALKPGERQTFRADLVEVYCMLGP
jgi:hypothetical protein